MRTEDENIEQQLKLLATQSKSHLAQDDLTCLAEKQQRSNEFMRLGVFGLLTIILTLFAPLLKNNQHRKLTQRRSHNE